MKKENVFAVFLIVICLYFIVFLATGASAAFTYSNSGSSIQRTYNGGETIKGTINLSLKNEPASSVFTTNFQGNISLLDFLSKNGLVEGTDFTCSISACSSTYSSKGSPITSLDLPKNKKQSVGFKVSGTEIQITSAALSLSSDLESSCDNELSVLIPSGENGTVIQNYKYVNKTCGSVKRGCFDTSLSDYQNPALTINRLCEKISLPIAPAFSVGAKVKNSTSGSADLKMEILDEEFNDLSKSCLLPKQTSSNQEISCTIPLSNFQVKSYYVCISSSSNSVDYRINAESAGSVCGASGEEESGYDYNIFAQPLEFDIPNIVLNDSTYEAETGETLSDYANWYIDNYYSGNCSSSCIIPFEINSKTSQAVSFDYILIKYDAKGLPGNVNTNLYTIEKSDSTINSKPILLDISKAGFTIPVTTTQKNLQLNLGSSSIFYLPVNITNSFGFNISQRVALLGANTKFNLILLGNVSSISWNFGDSSNPVITQEKSVSHKYSEVGDYNLEVEVTRLDGVKATRSFAISVQGGRAAADTLIKQFEQKINKTSNQINQFDPFLKAQVEKKVNLTSLKNSLAQAKLDYVNASDEQANEIVSNLVSLTAPDSIDIAEQGELPADLGFDNINSEYAVFLSGNNTDLSSTEIESLKDKLLNYNTDNYNTNIAFKSIVEVQESTVTPLFTYFNIKIDPKQNTPKEDNLIVAYPKEEITFKENYGAKAISGSSSSATAIPINGAKSVEFILPEKIDVSELGAYITPSLSEFSLEEVTPIAPNERPKTAIWLYVILFLAFIVVYIALQEWYKKRYESHLFKNKDDLYNIINFIFNSRVSMLSDNDIKGKLVSFNWTPEQLTYAFKKIDGKRTGMWEIPIFKFIENNKVKKEIEKRQQQNQQGERFIKRPY